MSFPEDVQDTLGRAGVNASSLDRIRLARGVVGKSSYVAGAAVLALAVVAWGVHGSSALLVVAALIALIFIVYFTGTIWFAHQHPGEALLEGAELIRWRQMEMGAKAVPPAEIEAKSTQQVLGREDSRVGR